MGNSVALIALLLVPAAAVIWLWWGVRKWQIGAVALLLGLAEAAAATIAYYGTDAVLGRALGPGPQNWLATRLALASGLALGGLVVIGLARSNRRGRGGQANGS